MVPYLPSSRQAVRMLAGAILLSLAALQAQPVLAQQSPNRGGLPAALLEARKAWATAVQRSNGPAAAALAVLPLQYEAYQSSKTATRAQYIREVSDWSTLRACLANEPIKPVKRRTRLGTHEFNCDGHGFFFAEKGGVWRHTGYENSNE